MTALSANNPDRREYPREAINSQIKYRFYDDTAYCAGKLVDLSLSGALVELRHRLPENTRISMLTTAENSDEPPVEIIAEIIRQSEASSDKHYAYGCIILDIINH